MTQTSDAFGSLTALFTSETDAQGAPRAPGADGSSQASRESEAGLQAASAPVVVLVGNLPVMAGLWTTQLADTIARNGGPTALVRFERGEVTMELLHADGRQLPAPGPEAIERWLPRAAAQMRRWLVCVPAETAPAEVLASGGDLLLMTGADEVAVVHAYHQLKRLSDEASHRGRPLTRVGLVVVGAPDERVDAVAAKMEEAARSFLGLELAVVARMPRLERTQSSARATYPATETPAFVDLMQALAQAREEAGTRFDAPAAEEPRFAQPAAPQMAPRLTPMDPADEPVAEPAPVAASGTAKFGVGAGVAQQASVGGTTGTGGTPARKPGRLVSHLRGLRPLGISCPMAPEIELALDDAGGLQIVGRADQLARVRVAHHWARQHRELLGLAFPELVREFRIVERLLLQDAREAISLHGTGVLLDLLVQVETPAGPVSTVVPLNDPATAG